MPALKPKYTVAIVVTDEDGQQRCMHQGTAYADDADKAFREVMRRDFRWSDEEPDEWVEIDPWGTEG